MFPLYLNKTKQISQINNKVNKKVNKMSNNRFRFKQPLNQKSFVLDFPI